MVQLPDDDGKVELVMYLRSYAGRLLEKPVNLPLHREGLNLKTAITIPLPLLGRAEEAIE